MRQGKWATSRRFLPALIALGAFLLLAWPVLDPDVQLFYRDTGRLYYPVKKYMAERLRQGQLPFWDPWTESGVSVLGQVSPGMLHPWSLLYLIFPFDLAFKLNHLLPLLLAGAGLYLLARRLGASRTGATAGGVVFGACGYLVSQAASNIIYVVGPAGVPLALERFIALLDKPSRGRLLSASALLALCTYGGEPQSMLVGGLIGAAFAVARALSRRKELPRALLLTAAWGGLALALSAPVALPAASQVSRRAKGLSRYELEHFAVSPERLPGLFVPRAFDDAPELAASLRESRGLSPFEEYFDGVSFAPSIYLGTGALLFALFALLGGRRGRFFLYGGLLFALAATGEKLGLQPILHRVVPGFGLFRYAEKLIAFASLMLAVAAALGADAAFRSRRRAVALAALAGLSSAVFATGSFLATERAGALRDWFATRGQIHSPEAAASFVSSLQGGLLQEGELIGLFALAALAFVLRPRLPGAALATATCAAASLASAGTQLITIPIENFRDPPPLAPELERIAGPSAGRWRLYVRPELGIVAQDLDPKTSSNLNVREPLRPQFDALFHIEGVSDYFSVPDPDFAPLLEGAPRESFSLLTVRFFLTMPRGLTDAHAAELGFQRIHYGMWLLTLPAGPRARLLDHAETAPDMPALAARLRAVDATRTAILLPRDAQAATLVAPARGSPGTVALTRISPEHMHAEVNARSAAILEVGEHYDAGWSTQVDGKPAATLAVDGAIAGVVVPAGHHEVELRFRPTGLAAGIGVAILALMILIVTNRVGRLTLSVTNRV
ncbi:MAG TPA: YfhO family protein [Myxococcales bacterium]|nr:YfhO family protein [Myxococcales bacterium]